MSDELRLGKIGELLVCVDLMEKGFIPTLCEFGVAYDILCDTGEKILRIQVKTTESPTSTIIGANAIPTYRFSVKRGTHHDSRYTDGVDIFAFVTKDTKQVGYIWAKDVNIGTFCIRADEFRGQYQDEKTLDRYLRAKKLREDGYSSKQIAEIMKEPKTTIDGLFARSKKSMFKGIDEKRYMIGYQRDREWFLNGK